MLKDKFTIHLDDDKEHTYQLTREGNMFKVSWEHRACEYDTKPFCYYTEASANQLINKGHWVVIEPLPDSFYFKREKTDLIFHAVRGDGWEEKEEEYRIDWITQGGQPETQAYYPVEAVERFVSIGQWIQVPDPCKREQILASIRRFRSELARLQEELDSLTKDCEDALAGT